MNSKTFIKLNFGFDSVFNQMHLRYKGKFLKMFSKKVFGKQGDVNITCTGIRIISLLVFKQNYKDVRILLDKYRKILHIVSTIIV